MKQKLEDAKGKSRSRVSSGKEKGLLSWSILQSYWAGVVKSEEKKKQEEDV
jgi:hypothetical protein